MMNKKKLCIIIVIAIIVTGLAVTFAVLSKSGKHKENVNEETTVNNEKQTDSVTEAAKADERKQVQTSVTMQFKQSNSWEGNGRFYAQYDLIIDNKEDVKISDWTFKINTTNGTTLEQSWNCTVDTSDLQWSVVPVDYNKIIESQAQMNNVGFIISFASKEELKKYTLDFKLESGMMMERHIKREKKLQIQVKNQQWWKIQHQEMIQHSLVEVILEIIQEITLIREAMQV